MDSIHAVKGISEESQGLFKKKGKKRKSIKPQKKKKMTEVIEDQVQSDEQLFFLLFIVPFQWQPQI